MEQLEAGQVEVVSGRPRGVKPKAIPAALDRPHQVGACRRVLSDVGPVNGHPEKAQPGYPPKVARADQNWLTVELVGNNLCVLLAHGGVLGEGAELPPRQAPLDVVDKAGRPEEEAAVLSFVPRAVGPDQTEVLARRRHCDDDDRLAVGVDLFDDAGDVVGRVFGQIAPLPEPGQALLDHPSASAVDLPRKGRLQLPEAPVQDVGRRADPVEEREEDDFPAVRGTLSESNSLGRRPGYPVPGGRPCVCCRRWATTADPTSPTGAGRLDDHRRVSTADTAGGIPCRRRAANLGLGRLDGHLDGRLGGLLFDRRGLLPGLRVDLGCLLRRGGRVIGPAPVLAVCAATSASGAARRVGLEVVVVGAAVGGVALGRRLDVRRGLVHHRRVGHDLGGPP